MNITLFGITFIFQALGFITIFSKLKDKRVYEYMVICGLDRMRFFLGVFVYILLEVLAVALYCGIVFSIVGTISRSVGTNFAVSLLLIIPVLPFSFGFALLSFSIFNTMNSASTFFALCGIMVAYVVTIIQMVFVLNNYATDIRIVMAILSVFFPGTLITLAL